MQIYKISNSINDRIYIGKEKNDKENYFGSGILIKQAICKYGKDKFKKEILESCSSYEELSIKEIFWIKSLNSHISYGGYNLTWGGDGGDTTSWHPNKLEIIEKRRKNNIGKKRTKEFCLLMKRIAINVDPKIRKTAGELGAKTKRDRIKYVGYTEKELAAQTKNKNTLVNYNKSEEGRRRVSEFMKGRKPKPFTDEQKQRIGNASKGRIPPNRRKVTIMNIEYLHMHEASKLLKIPLSTIQNRLLSKNFKDWNYSE